MEWTPPAYLELIVLSEVASGFDSDGTARDLSRGDPSGVRSNGMARELSIGDPLGSKAMEQFGNVHFLGELWLREARI